MVGNDVSSGYAITVRSPIEYTQALLSYTGSDP